MNDIETALVDLFVERRAGWNKKAKTRDQTRCVALCAEDFVVIVRFGLTQEGFLKGKFVTCFVADNSIDKIRRAPQWDEAACTLQL